MGILNPKEFVSDIMKWGISSPNKYEVKFAMPNGATDYSNVYPSVATQSNLQLLGSPVMAKSIALRCSSMQFPARGIQTLDDKEYGTTKKIPFTTDYNAVDFSFIASKDLYERVYFEAWQNLVINPVSNTVSFWDEYTADVEMSQLNIETEEPTYTIKLKQAYPISVSAMDYGYDKTNEFQIINVSMIYKYWINVYPLQQDVYAV